MLVFLTLKGTLKQSTVCCGMSKNSTWSVYFSQFQNLWWTAPNQREIHIWLFQTFVVIMISSGQLFSVGCSTSNIGLFSTGLLQATAINQMIATGEGIRQCYNIGEFYHYFNPVLPPELSYLDSRVLGATCLKRQTFAHSQGWSLDWIACLSRRNCSSARPYVAELFFECETNKHIDK